MYKRQGVSSLPIADIVVGDLVLLQAGERIPADGILISGRLSVDQSALNGETKEAEKTPGGEEGRHGDGDLLSHNQLFRGTVVCAGEGVMLVRRVGDATFYGGLAREIQEETREKMCIRDRVNAIASVPTAAGDMPREDVTITSIDIRTYG